MVRKHWQIEGNITQGLHASAVACVHRKCLASFFYVTSANDKHHQPRSSCIWRGLCAYFNQPRTTTCRVIQYWKTHYLYKYVIYQLVSNVLKYFHIFPTFIHCLNFFTIFIFLIQILTLLNLMLYLLVNFLHKFYNFLEFSYFWWLITNFLNLTNKNKYKKCLNCWI